MAGMSPDTERVREAGPGGDLTDLLRAWAAGDEAAESALMDRVYRELKAMAGAELRRERGDHTLQPTALVHEVYLRLVDQDRADWKSRAQFFDVAARMMRRILVDHARRRRRLKRGGGAERVSLGSTAALAPHAFEDVLALDEALERLERLDPRQTRIVELHFIAGLSVAETAEALACSKATVSRDWREARMWLARELGGRPGDGA
jgi:RNA polymerase sigma factor (TIGR02999 family)